MMTSLLAHVDDAEAEGGAEGGAGGATPYMGLRCAPACHLIEVWCERVRELSLSVTRLTSADDPSGAAVTSAQNIVSQLHSLGCVVWSMQLIDIHSPDGARLERMAL